MTHADSADTTTITPTVSATERARCAAADSAGRRCGGPTILETWCRTRSSACPRESERVAAMPMFVVEREFAETFDPDQETLRLVDQYHLDNDIKWLTSFLSADKKKTYCLYECADIEVLRRHARDLGIPADEITQVDEFVR